MASDEDVAEYVRLKKMRDYYYKLAAEARASKDGRVDDKESGNRIRISANTAEGFASAYAGDMSTIYYKQNDKIAFENAVYDYVPPSDDMYNSDYKANVSYDKPGYADAKSSYYSNPDGLTEKLKSIVDKSYQFAGFGSYNNLFQNFLSRLDRHGTAFVPLNTMNYGFTFITRPRLNMTSGNLSQHPVLSTLRSSNPNSVAFMIRCLLDTRLSNGWPINISEPRDNIEIHAFAKEYVARSGLVDQFNPFFTPLCNGLKGVTGWPDLNLETETYNEDFHSGDFTYVKGSDLNNRTTELSLEFRDIQGSVILAIFHYWCLYIALQAKGVVMAYPDDIYQQRLNYTVSIYRFITDVSRKHILWWSKATGCFPKSAPIGALFNLNRDEVTISSAMNFSIPFTVNDVKYQDPGILSDFRLLVERYCNNIQQWKCTPDLDLSATPKSRYNFNSLPFIEPASNGGWDLVWKTDESYYTDDSSTTQQQ